MSVFEGTSYQAVDCMSKQAKATRTMDMSVDVLGSRRGADSRLAAEGDPDATECSSSFADTASEDENCLGLSDAEVESQFYGSYDGLGSLFPIRKKKLTNHWRNFILPLMWRCRWAELKLKEFESQASKYNGKMAEYDQKKLASYDASIVQENGTRSLPVTLQYNRKWYLRRRKRRKVEQSADVAAYMANHHLFSCRENKKFDPDLTSVGDDLCNPGQKSVATDDFGLNDDCPIHEEDTNSQEQMLGKIDLLHSRVNNLKSQLDSIMNKYAAKFSSSESLSHLGNFDGQTSSPASPTFSACNGDMVSVGGLYSSIQQMPDYDSGDLALPDTAVSSFREAALIPDVIESTVGLLSSTSVTQHEAQFADSCEKIVDNIVMHQEAAEIETEAVKKIPNQAVDKHQDAEASGEEEETSNPSHPSSDPDRKSKSLSSVAPGLRSGLASDIHFPKSKRKRGERKAGAGGWQRHQSGDA